jgi:hypothetical protein
MGQSRMQREARLNHTIPVDESMNPSAARDSRRAK